MSGDKFVYPHTLEIFLCIIFVIFVAINPASPENICLEGWILDDQSGSPIEGANLNITEHSEYQVTISTERSDAMGYYRHCSTETGLYPIVVWKYGFSPERMKVDLPNSNNSMNFRL